jgi:hypothetical protein
MSSSFQTTITTMPKKPAPVEKHNPWVQVDPASIILYTLPAGIQKNCEHCDEKEKSAGCRAIFIGTSDGVYYAFVSLERGAKASEANQVGLEGKNIVKLEQRDEKIIAFTEDDKVYTASNFALKGTR